jgi:hypothetical protein
VVRGIDAASVDRRSMEEPPDGRFERKSSTAENNSFGPIIRFRRTVFPGMRMLSGQSTPAIYHSGKREKASFPKPEEDDHA